MSHRSESTSPRLPAPNDRRVVVLGAGPAGLSAAHVLARSGVHVDVLELKDRVGGLCITIEKEGFRFDLGGHRWFTKNEALHQWFLELMEGELVDVDRVSRIYFDGKYFNYPIAVMNVLKSAGVFPSAKAFLSYLVAAGRDLLAPREPQNIKDAYVEQFGNTLFEMFFRRYTEKVWGLTCEELSPDWVSQRSKGLSLVSALKDAIWKSRSVASLIDQFVYPRWGYERICLRMAEDVTDWGGQVHLSSPVRRLEYLGPQQWRVHHDGPDGAGVLEATDLISTLPLGHLVRMIEPETDSAAVAAAKALSFRDLIVVCVFLKKAQVTPDTWLYLHDEDLIFARLHEPKNWSPDMVPDASCTSVVCEIFSSRGDEVWQMSDEAIGDRVVADLADKLGFVERHEVLDFEVVRAPFAYPVYDLAYRGNIETIYDFIRRFDGLHIVGRGGTFRYNNADHSIEMGQLLGKSLLGVATDHMSVNTEKAYLEEIRLVKAGGE